MKLASPIFTTLLFCVALISCMEPNEVSRKIEASIASYHPAPKMNSPLDKHLVMNDFWRDMQNKSQEEKDDALRRTLNLNSNHEVMRYLIAAGIYAGADPNTWSEYGPFKFCLELAVVKDDLSLAQLLLAHKAKVLINGIFGIRRSKSKAMSALLIEKIQIQDIPEGYYGYNVLVHYGAPEMIHYYITLGIEGKVFLRNLVKYKRVDPYAPGFIEYAQATIEAGISPEKILQACKKAKAGLQGEDKRVIEENEEQFIKFITQHK